jgi:hypothetical protein
MAEMCLLPPKLRGFPLVRGVEHGLVGVIGLTLLLEERPPT